MARIYSWQLTDTKFAYITGINDNEPFVGNRLKAEDYNTVVFKVDNMTSSQYSNNFDKLCLLCNQYGLDPTKNGTVTATAFYDTTTWEITDRGDFMVVLVGRDGEKGEQGPKGDPGKDGKDGVTPDTPIPYISITAYCSTGDRDIRPDTPKEGDIIIKWDPDTKQYTFEDTKGDWYLYDSDANDNDGDGSDKSIIWQSSAVYNDQGIVSPWTKPIRITGANGEPGADGNNIEFIYTRRTFPMIDEDPPISVNENKHVPENWTGSPVGIDEKYKYEYMCQRRKDANDIWGPWEGPTVWSRWGDDGKDGDGVEYVYYTTNGTQPNFRCEDDIDTEEYQKSEYKPIVQMPIGANDSWADVVDENNVPVKWFDNPQQIDAEEHRAQWVLVRKRRVEDGQTKSKWGQFEGPSLWSMYGEKGDQGIEGLNVYERKMYQSYNANSAPSYIRDKFDPGFPWAPAVPKEKGENEAIWCIEAYIKLITVKDENGEVTDYEQQLCWYDGKTDERVVNEETQETDVPHWSVPYIIEGRDGADMVHNNEQIFKCVALEEGKLVPPELPSTNIKNEDYYIPSDEGWERYPTRLSNETPVCYMCYRDRIFDEWWGEWSDWKGPFLYTQLGTEGPAGLDGADGKDAYGTEYVYTTTFTSEKPVCYIPPEDYDNGNYQKDEYLPYVDSEYTVKWSDEPQGVDDGNPYEWVISRTKLYDEKNDIIKWGDFSKPAIFAKWGYNGKDGKDIEYVYALTKTDLKPGVKEYVNDSDIAQSPEFYPEIEYSGNSSDVSGNTSNGKLYWMDNAKDVSKDWPYQWEMVRKRVSKTNPDNANLYIYEWEKYTNDKVSLHSKWGRDGDQGRQGVAGVAGIHYEMRFIRARQDEDDNIFLYVPEIKNGTYTGKFIEVHYVDDNNVEQDAWKNYWYNTKHPDVDGEDITYLYQTRNLSKTYFPLYSDMLTAEEEYPYMFFIQSRITTKREEIKEENPNNKQEEIVGFNEVEVLENGQWEAPVRLTGKQGIQGPEGKRGPILFSAGVYGTGKKYYTTDTKKPYVLDPVDKEYYYLDKGNFSANSDCNDGNGPDTTGMEYWYTEYDIADGSKNNLPSTDAIDEVNPHWVKMEQFDVILANVGIFKSALVGSGVFYGEWFYSQNGTLSDGTKSESVTNADGIVVTSSRYEEFDPDTRILTKTNGGGNGTSKEPYINWGKDNNFKPFLALNLMDGSGWLAGTNILWDSDGNMNIKGSGVGSFGNGAFTWDDENIYINKNLKMGSGVTISWANVDSSEIDKDIQAAKDAADAAKDRMDGWVADNIITRFEVFGLKDELSFIIADKNDIDNKCTQYGLNESDNDTKSTYDTNYESYKTNLDTIIEEFEKEGLSLESTVVPDGFPESQNNYYSARTDILSAIAKAEQGHMDNAADAARQAAEEYTNGRTSDEYITNITERTITTEWLNAKEITAAHITTEALTAKSSEIKDLVAENIEVRKLNTTGEGKIGAGTITIVGNDIKVYDSKATKEVLNITGREITDFPSATTKNLSEKTVHLLNGEFGTTFKNGIYGKYTTGSTVIGQFTIPNDGFSYQLADDDPSFEYHMNFSTDIFNKEFKTWVQLGVGFYVTTSNTPIDITEISNHIFEQGKYWLFPEVSDEFTGEAKYTIEGKEQRWMDERGDSLGSYPYFSADVANNKPVTYYIHAAWAINNDGEADNPDVFYDLLVKFNVTMPDLSIVPNTARCDISSHGFRYVVDKDKYVQFTKYGNFIIKNGVNALKWNATGGMYFIIEDTEYPILAREIIYKDSLTTRKKTMFLTLGEPSSFDDA